MGRLTSIFAGRHAGERVACGLNAQLECLSVSSINFDFTKMSDPFVNSDLILEKTYQKNVPGSMIGSVGEEERCSLVAMTQEAEEHVAAFEMLSNNEAARETESCCRSLSSFRVHASVQSVMKLMSLNHQKDLQERMRREQGMEPFFAELLRTGIAVDRRKLFRQTEFLQDRLRYLVWCINRNLRSQQFSSTQSQHTFSAAEEQRLSLLVHQETRHFTAGGKTGSTLDPLEVRRIMNIMYQCELNESWTNDALGDWQKQHPDIIVPWILEHRKLSTLLNKIERLPFPKRKQGVIRFRPKRITKRSKNGRISMSDGLQCIPKPVPITLPPRKSVHDMMHDLSLLQENQMDQNLDPLLDRDMVEERHEKLVQEVGLPKSGANCLVVNHNGVVLIATFRNIDQKRTVGDPMRYSAKVNREEEEGKVDSETKLKMNLSKDSQKKKDKDKEQNEDDVVMGDENVENVENDENIENSSRFQRAVDEEQDGSDAREPLIKRSRTVVENNERAWVAMDLVDSDDVSSSTTTSSTTASTSARSWLNQNPNNSLSFVAPPVAEQSMREWWNIKSGVPNLYSSKRAGLVSQVNVYIGATSGKDYTFPADMVYPLSDKGYWKEEHPTAVDPPCRLPFVPWKNEGGNSVVGIRKAFVARSNCVLMAMDYKQVEMRIAAHFSGCQQFQQIFSKENPDPFRTVAALLLGIKDDELEQHSKVTEEDRTNAKQRCYGMLYGQSLKNSGGDGGGGSSATSFGKLFPGIGKYHAAVREEFEALGGVTTIGGHFRECDALTVAYNAKAQGSAADIFKAVLRTIHQRLRVEIPTARVVLIVHDEIILEVPNKVIERTAALVKKEMERGSNNFNMRVPLIASYKIGKTYGTLVDQ